METGNMERKFEYYGQRIREHSEFAKMKDYIQHGRITTYDHVNDVTKTAYKIARGLRIRFNERVLIQGALLHDFFGYDWHDTKEKKPLFKKHGFTHAKEASRRAKEIFGIDKHTEDVINSHMWPLTLRSIPKSREALILCFADKIVSFKETVFKR